MIRHAFLLATFAATLAAAQPVAMVVDLAGKAAWDRITPAHITDAVMPERLLSLEPGARLVVVFLKTGTEQVFAGPAQIRFKPDGGVEGGQAASTRRLQALQGKLQLRPAALAQASVVMKEMVFEPGFRIDDWPRLKPSGPGLLDPSAEFTWAPLAGAKYTLRITDDQRRPVLEVTGIEARLKLPVPSPLRSGRTYGWSLVAECPDGSRRSETGHFRLLDETEREGLQAAKPGPEAGFADRLLYASLLDQLEVKDEAKALWQALARERPEDPNLRRLSRD